MNLTDQQLATTLAALRQFQRAGADAKVADYFTEHAPLNAEEIDALVDQLNTASKPPSVLVVIEGGTVANVCSNAPVEVCVKDFDCINEQGIAWSATVFQTQQLDEVAFKAAVIADVPTKTEVTE